MDEQLKRNALDYHRTSTLIILLIVIVAIIDKAANLLKRKPSSVLLLLVYEHSLVSARDQSRLNAAFFTMNGVISVTFAVFVIVDAVG